jgi:hypothetical protein
MIAQAQESKPHVIHSSETGAFSQSSIDCARCNSKQEHLFRLHHPCVRHSALPPSDEAKAHEAVHTAPNDFGSDLIPRSQDVRSAQEVVARTP